MRRSRLTLVALVVGVAVTGAVVARRAFEMDARTGPVPPKGCDSSGPRWDVKTLTDPAASRVDLQPIDTTVSRLVSLQPTVPSQNDTPRQLPYEFHAYRVHALVKRVDYSSDDSDMTAVIADPADPSKIMGIEFPDVRCSPASTSRVVSQMSSARRALIASCGWHGDESYRPGAGSYGRATVVGIVFFDVVHEETDFPEPGSSIELHPVLSYEPSGRCVRQGGSTSQ